jgi:hypothetical protein
MTVRPILPIGIAKAFEASLVKLFPVFPRMEPPGGGIGHPSSDGLFVRGREGLIVPRN